MGSATIKQSKSNLTPNGRNLLWEHLEPRLLAAGRDFIAGTITYEAYNTECRTVRALLDL